jgi:DNA-binding winged helix-turn-helix (wHTH) protein
MIPKSGYRFSDKIMRKKDHSQSRPAEQDRVTPKAAVGPASARSCPTNKREAERRQAH